MYDILVFLFENCQQAELAYDSDRVAKKLSAAGFEDSDISEAMHWLDGVLHAPQGVREAMPDLSASFRAYAPRELAQARCRLPRLSDDARAIGHPDAEDARAGDRARARRSGDRSTLEQLKLVVLMVLWNQQMPTSRLLAEDLFSAPQAGCQASLARACAR
jgi:Smg protein